MASEFGEMASWALPLISVSAGWRKSASLDIPNIKKEKPAIVRAFLSVWEYMRNAIRGALDALL